MSYAGPATRNRGSARRPCRPGQSATRSVPRLRCSGVADEGDYHETDWQQVAIFGAGLALGLALGAGTALLTAPQSGEETRAALRGRARRIGRTTSRRSRDAWEDLRDELRVGEDGTAPAPRQAHARSANCGARWNAKRRSDRGSAEVLQLGLRLGLIVLVVVLGARAADHDLVLLARPSSCRRAPRRRAPGRDDGPADRDPTATDSSM